MASLYKVDPNFVARNQLGLIVRAPRWGDSQKIPLKEENDSSDRELISKWVVRGAITP